LKSHSEHSALTFFHGVRGAHVFHSRGEQSVLTLR
jgi:hypothetical protein